MHAILCVEICGELSVKVDVEVMENNLCLVQIGFDDDLCYVNVCKWKVYLIECDLY